MAMYPRAVAQVVAAVGEVLGADMNKILAGDAAPESVAASQLVQVAE